VIATRSGLIDGRTAQSPAKRLVEMIDGEFAPDLWWPGGVAGSFESLSTASRRVDSGCIRV